MHTPAVGGPPAKTAASGRTFAMSADRELRLAGFERLLSRLPVAEIRRADLRRRYAELRRRYHDAAHISLLCLRRLLHGGAEDDLGAMLAVGFHDAVLDPAAAPGANEAASAALLERAAFEAGLGPGPVAWSGRRGRRDGRPLGPPGPRRPRVALSRPRPDAAGRTP